jgi:hypothetical protein
MSRKLEDRIAEARDMKMVELFGKIPIMRNTVLKKKQGKEL